MSVIMLMKELFCLPWIIAIIDFSNPEINYDTVIIHVLK